MRFIYVFLGVAFVVARYMTRRWWQHLRCAEGEAGRIHACQLCSSNAVLCWQNLDSHLTCQYLLHHFLHHSVAMRH